MSIHRETISIVCDRCERVANTYAFTIPGARGWAERHGWHVAHLAGGMHHKKSADPKKADVCPECLPGKPANLIDGEVQS